MVWVMGWLLGQLDRVAVGVLWWALVGWGGDHELEALFGGRQLRDVVFGVGAADVLLHGAEALLLWHAAWSDIGRVGNVR